MFYDKEAIYRKSGQLPCYIKRFKRDGYTFMNKKDKLTVENFVSTGMELETLYVCFPDFAKEEIAAIYEEYRDNDELFVRPGNVSINCS